MNIKAHLKSVINLLKKLSFVLSDRQKRLIPFMIIITFVNAFAQTLGVASIAPFLQILSDGEEFIGSGKWGLLYKWLNISQIPKLVIASGSFIIAIYLFIGFMGIFQAWAAAKFSNKVQREMSVSILRAYMHKSYDFFLDYNTAKIIRDVDDDANGVNFLLNSLITIVTESATMILIFVYIFLEDWKIAVCVSLLAVICLVTIINIYRRKAIRSGESFRKYNAESKGSLLDAIEGIKEIQVMRRQGYFIDRYEDTFIKKQKPLIKKTVYSAVPVNVIQAVFILGIIIFISVRFIINPAYSKEIPMLASFMLGAIRMLPSLGRLSSCANSVGYWMPSLDSVYNTFLKVNSDKIEQKQQTEISKISSHKFKELVLDNVSWHYNGSEKNVLSEINLTVKRGESIGLIGASGSGKTTLADIILGLHHPQSGTVKLDGEDIFSIGEAYANVIGFVPQTVHLLDATIAENIAFGIPRENIDYEAVKSAAEQAQLDKFIESSESGLETEIGERGVRLSGGQRQRIAIARALYRNPQILVLDEATSALDNETEEAVMNAIEHLYGTITMIIIAHRLTTIKECDTIYEIKDGKAVKCDKSIIFGKDKKDVK